MEKKHNTWNTLYSDYINNDFKNWDEYFRTKMKLKKPFFNLIVKYSIDGKPVLECGSGTGKFSVYLASLGYTAGLMHISQTSSGNDVVYQVTAFDQVEDGANLLQSAKKIFGDKFDAFQTINSDEQKREKLRSEVLASYVKKNRLSATFYQDYGWPAKKIGE